MFHSVATTVPAYQAFLREHGIEPTSIQTLEDFQKLPLVTKENYHRRYHISDNGGLIPYEAMLKFLAEWGFDPLGELQKQGGRGIHALPFVYVFGRSNFTVSYFGANIYPENVAVGLEQSEIQEWVTGKFVLQVKEDADKNRFLSIVVELAPLVESSEEKQKAIASSILSQLLRLNSEFANYVPPEYQMPQVTLAPTGDSEYFPTGVKHRYTRQ